MSVGLHNRLKSNLKGLFGFAFTLTRNEDTARDLVQDSAVKALAAKNIPEDDTAFRVWLFQILRNSFIDDARRSRPISADPGDLDKHLGSDGWSEHRQVNVVAVRHAFAHLSIEHRQVLALVDIAGMSYAEAAEVLAVPVGTIMSRVSRARSALLQQIETDNVTPFPRAPKRAQR